MRIAAEAVMNGLIGKVVQVNVGLPTGRGTDEEGKVAQPIPLTWTTPLVWAQP